MTPTRFIAVLKKTPVKKKTISLRVTVFVIDALIKHQLIINVQYKPFHNIRTAPRCLAKQIKRYPSMFGGCPRIARAPRADDRVNNVRSINYASWIMQSHQHWIWWSISLIFWCHTYYFNIWKRFTKLQKVVMLFISVWYEHISTWNLAPKWKRDSAESSTVTYLQKLVPLY